MTIPAGLWAADHCGMPPEPRQPQPYQSDEPSAAMAGRPLACAERLLSPVLVVEATGLISYANPATAWALGCTQTALRGSQVLDLVHPLDRRRARYDLAEAVAGRRLLSPHEYRVRGKDSGWKTVSAVVLDLLAGSPPSGPLLVLNVIDISEQKAEEQSLRKLAFSDPATGLANRHALAEHLEGAMSGEGDLAVAFVALDRFKWVNDCLGHTVGDAVLQAAGSRISALLAPGSSVFHFGADIFVVVMAGLGQDQAVALTWAITARLTDPLFISGHEVRISASGGVAFQGAAATRESILSDADTALNRAKTSRRGGVEVFTEEMRAQAVERVAMEVDLRHAIERGELRLVFQPVVSLLDGRLVGNEALMRWERRGQVVSPLTFIPLAEETGLIMAVGDWALGNAIRAVRAGGVTKAFVNLSARQLLDPGLPARVEQLFKASRIAPRALGFEVTETVVIENYGLAVECLRRLRHLGCSVGLDDFGVGYSSLGYLRRLPVDFLKLDRELVRDLGSDAQVAPIAEAIISMAHSLGLTTTAEGIEEQAQADALTVMGCDFGQGWLFGRPAPAPSHAGTPARPNGCRPSRKARIPG
ncbi:MAG TPA: GGDEF domain-containing protein [Acidimicrobiales bacterium]|nr:GGDEF domain-containing protein [Acidimicrobiales bacterium]